MLLVFSSPLTAIGDELTVDSYILLTRDILEATADWWEQSGTPPDPSAIAFLYAVYGCSEYEYLSFMGAHAAEVETHLSHRPALKAEIEELHQRIRDAIATRETP